jgi:hypothetical protein
MSYNFILLLTELDIKGYVKLEIPDSAIRKTIHEYCEKQSDLTHISYYNKECKHDSLKSEYWCDECKHWKRDDSKQTKIRYCCENEYGGQGCLDWIIRCTHCGGVIWHQDAYDDSNYKRKQTITNNAMLIFRGDMYIKENKELIKSIGMKTRTVNKKKKRFQIK